MRKRSESDQKIWDSGWLAHNAGIDSERCPFAPRCAARRLWMAGWRAAAINADKAVCENIGG